MAATTGLGGSVKATGSVMATTTGLGGSVIGAKYHAATSP